MIPIIIGNYNKPELTAQCIDSIRENTPEGYSIVLVENGDKHCKKHQNVNRVVYNEPLGFTKTYNEGIRFARKNIVDWKYICLMNNDVTVRLGWLEPLIKTMESREKVAIVTPIIDSPKKKEHYDVPAHADLIGGHIYSVRRDKYEKDKVEEYPSINFACVLINRDFLDDHGILDESMHTFCSDQDLALRATRSGWKCFVCHESIVGHELNATVNDGTLIPADEKIKLVREDQKTFLDKWSGLWLNDIMRDIPLHLKNKYHAAVSFFIRYTDGTIVNWKTGELVKDPQKVIDTENVSEKFDKIKKEGLTN